MQFLFVLAVGSLAGVTTAGKLDQFWADNFKAFEQIYGKTNDKQIYGATLPPPVSFEGDLNKDASDNKEHFYSQEDFSESYNIRDSYKDPLIDNQFKKRKPNFISYSDFKPISKNSDPETYNFLKHLDEIDQSQRSRSKSKPRYDYSSVIEDSEAYKSIQEILDAHETKRSRDRGDRRYSSKTKKSNRLYSYGPKKSKCPTGSCRQRTKTIRVRTGPYIKSGKK